MPPFTHHALTPISERSRIVRVRKNPSTSVKGSDAMRRRINGCEAHHKSQPDRIHPNGKLSETLSFQVRSLQNDGWILVEIKEFTYLVNRDLKVLFSTFLGVDLTTYPCRRRQPLETPLKRKEQVMAYENTMVVFFIASFVALFPMLDPFGNMPIFTGLTEGIPNSLSRRVAVERTLLH